MEYFSVENEHEEFWASQISMLTLLMSQDYRSNAEKAKLELDGKPVRGRNIKVRFAAHGAALKVKNLNPWVSNELLEKAFSVFGEVCCSTSLVILIWLRSGK